MTELFLDFETTGLPKENRPPDDPLQPSIIEVGAILRENMIEQARLSFLVVHNDPIPDGAFNVHGITSEQTQKYGIDGETAVRVVNDLLTRADVVVVHNVEFERKMFKIMCARMKVPCAWPEKEFCTMLEIIARGYSKKRPQLGKAVLMTVPKEKHNDVLPVKHRALGDAITCMAVYDGLKDLEGK